MLLCSVSDSPVRGWHGGFYLTGSRRCSSEMFENRVRRSGVGRKLLVRLGLRGRHPHPPAPSPASGRGGEARLALGQSDGSDRSDRSDRSVPRQAIARSLGLCPGPRCISVLCAWVCAVTTLTPRPPLPPAGEGEKRVGGTVPASGRGGEARFAPRDLKELPNACEVPIEGQTKLPTPKTATMNRSSSHPTEMTQSPSRSLAVAARSTS